MLFQAVRGGIESVWVLDRSHRPITPRILTLDLMRSEYTDDDRLQFIVLPANHSERLCRPIQFLRIERFSFLPDSQRDSGDLASQCQPRHLFANALVLQTL